jgi:hypothetical protein
MQADRRVPSSLLCCAVMCCAFHLHNFGCSFELEVALWIHVGLDFDLVVDRLNIEWEKHVGRVFFCTPNPILPLFLSPFPPRIPNPTIRGRAYTFKGNTLI